ncbi:Cardiac phospholamban [Heterocephalus glaber]|uniref:Phospholamban n=2 Tax=Heterocephalus glaber TaxID=10181 RepID=G5C1T7_HETGA|nr:Cardiac phospholamban [Heterocephalus glaber]
MTDETPQNSPAPPEGVRNTPLTGRSGSCTQKPGDGQEAPADRPRPEIITEPSTAAHPAGIMEKVQYLTRSAIRRASAIEMPQQARQNLQNLFINFCLILICLLLICIIVMLL